MTNLQKAFLIFEFFLQQMRFKYAQKYVMMAHNSFFMPIRHT